MTAIRARELIILLSLLAGLQTAHGRTADRELPADIDAGAMSREAGTATLSRGVLLRQGTLEVRSEDALILRDADGTLTQIQLTGTPATWVEEMDDGATLNARALRIDYDFKTEKVVLTGDVLINHGTDQITGEAVRYDLRSSRLDAGSAEGGRIKMRITPKDSDADGGDGGDGGP